MQNLNFKELHFETCHMSKGRTNGVLQNGPALGHVQAPWGIL